MVLCTPIRQFPEMMGKIAGVLPAGAIVTDVGSTKALVMQWAGEQLAGAAADRGVVFVGSHPMAGSEKRGPEHARADLYQGAVCLLCTEPAFAVGTTCPAKGSAEARVFRVLEKVEGMWQALGMRTLRVAAAEHDRWVAGISHLPHAVAFSLANAVAGYSEAFGAAAGGLMDTTRIASSDVDMWTDIFLTNRMPVLDAIGDMQRQLADLKKAIVFGDEAGIRAALVKARKVREQIVAGRAKG